MRLTYVLPQKPLLRQLHRTKEKFAPPVLGYWFSAQSVSSSFQW